MTSPERPVCLITGAATGIGAACARTFARYGWDVGICSLDDDTRPAAEAVAAECTALGAKAEVVLLNVTSDDSCRAAASAMRASAAALGAASAPSSSALLIIGPGVLGSMVAALWLQARAADHRHRRCRGRAARARHAAAGRAT
jgi:NAD(P)-dependent dehydrogenase (short-subunit alcohol dehydrogenase family)